MKEAKWLKEAMKETKRIEEDALYSSRRHAITATEFYYLRHILGLPTVVLAALIGLSIVKQHPFWGIAIPLVLTIFTAIVTFLNPSEREQTHHNAGADYLALRNRSRKFYEMEVKRENVTPKELKEEIDYLMNRRDELNKKSPRTPDWAYWLAKKSIEAGESDYKVDKSKSNKGI